jgi:hypothetical protein
MAASEVRAEIEGVFGQSRLKPSDSAECWSVTYRETTKLEST